MILITALGERVEIPWDFAQSLLRPILPADHRGDSHPGETDAGGADPRVQGVPPD